MGASKHTGASYRMTNNSENHSENDTGGETTLDEQKRDAIYTLVSESIETDFAAERHSTNRIFEVLANPGRRYVLTYLLQADGFVTISELVDYVTTRTNAKMTDREFRRKVTLELTHTHLPALEEDGFIRYNMERQLIMPTEATTLTEPYLRMALLQQRLVEEQLASQDQEVGE